MQKDVLFIFWHYFYIEITLFATHYITISNLHLLSISFSLSRECTVTMRTVDVLQFVVLTFGVSSKLKSNAAPAQLKLTQKIISQCMRTNYCEILQLFNLETCTQEKLEKMNYIKKNS